uniref:Immunoglobulin V-set domain-containing protein n=1 Tax=Myripristis murdjan TaxID=586833 RepID=A0A668A0P9_9TELE
MYSVFLWKWTKYKCCIYLISLFLFAPTEEGRSLSLRCEYPDSLRSNAKYFCRIDNTVFCQQLIKTAKHDQRVRDGRFSLFDNSTGRVFIVTMDRLTLGDSGFYNCGVDISLGRDHLSEMQLIISPGCVCVCVCARICSCVCSCMYLHKHLFAVMYICLFQQQQPFQRASSTAVSYICMPVYV